MVKPHSSLLSKILTILSVLLAVLCLASAWGYGHRNPGLDFYQFWAVGQKVIAERNINIYSDDARRSIGEEFFQRSRDNKSSRFTEVAVYRRTLETYSTPFLYSLFGIAGLKDYDYTYTLYELFCMICMVFAVLVIGRLLKFPLAVSLLFLSYFVSYFEPYLSEMRVANVNQIQLALLALFLWIQSRPEWKASDFFGGIVLGFIVMFKPNLVFVPLVLSIFWLINGESKKLILEYAGILFSIVSIIIFTGIFFGSAQCWVDWLKAVISIKENVITVNGGNYSLSMIIFDNFRVDISRYLAAVLIGVTALFIWIGRGNVSSDKGVNLNKGIDEILFTGIGCLIYLLSSRLVWLHYYIFIIPALLYILRPFSNASFERSRSSIFIGRGMALLAALLYAVPVLLLLGARREYHLTIGMIAATFILFILSLKASLGCCRTKQRSVSHS